MLDPSLILFLFSVMSNSLRPHGLYSPQNSPDQNTGVGSLSLLQGIFSTQGSNPGLPYCRQILYQLSHKGTPRILEWVVHAFSRGSSQPMNWTGVFCIAGRFFTNWAMREAHDLNQVPYDYAVEVTNRFKGFETVNSVPEELWMEVCNIVQEAANKTIPKKKKCKKAKWLSEEAL